MSGADMVVIETQMPGDMLIHLDGEGSVWGRDFKSASEEVRWLLRDGGIPFHQCADDDFAVWVPHRHFTSVERLLRDEGFDVVRRGATIVC